MITKTFLQERLEGLQYQHDDLLKKAFMVDGAIQDCREMLQRLEEEEAKEATGKAEEELKRAEG